MKHYELDVILLFLKNELSDEESSLITEHLSECAECQEKLDLWLAIKQSATEPLNDSSFVTSVMSQLPAIEEEFSLINFFASWKWQLSALTASAVILMMAYNFQTPELGEQFSQIFKTEESISYEL